MRQPRLTFGAIGFREPRPPADPLEADVRPGYVDPPEPPRTRLDALIETWLGPLTPYNAWQYQEAWKLFEEFKQDAIAAIRWAAEQRRAGITVLPMGVSAYARRLQRQRGDFAGGHSEWRGCWKA